MGDATETVTVPLVLTSRESKALNPNYINGAIWKPALKAAGPESTASEGRPDGMHALRHWYASVLLDAGENIKALSTYLGHSDPGFTFRTYTHLMPSSSDCTKKAVDDAFGYSAKEAKSARRVLDAYWGRTGKAHKSP